MVGCSVSSSRLTAWRLKEMQEFDRSEVTCIRVRVGSGHVCVVC